MARMMIVAALSLCLGTSCFEETSCDRYVEYMCDCHDGEEGYDCDELQSIYADADPGLQDQCAVDLSAQEVLDDEAGLDCGFDDSEL